MKWGKQKITSELMQSFSCRVADSPRVSLWHIQPDLSFFLSSSRLIAKKKKKKPFQIKGSQQGVTVALNRWLPSSCKHTWIRLEFLKPWKVSWAAIQVSKTRSRLSVRKKHPQWQNVAQNDLWEEVQESWTVNWDDPTQKAFAGPLS